MLAITDDLNIKYQLTLRKKVLARLCLRWQAKVDVVPCEGLDSLDGYSWGPSPTDLHSAVATQSVGGANPKSSCVQVSPDQHDEESDHSTEDRSSSVMSDNFSCDETSSESVVLTDFSCSPSNTPEFD
jgi:hypothetical protein